MNEIEQDSRDVEAVRSQDLDDLLNQHFKGRVVRKDLTKQLKEGANVPIYVLEYLQGQRETADGWHLVHHHRPVFF